MAQAKLWICATPHSLPSDENDRRLHERFNEIVPSDMHHDLSSTVMAATLGSSLSVPAQSAVVVVYSLLRGACGG
jgi:hypothetical protein